MLNAKRLIVVLQLLQFIDNRMGKGQIRVEYSMKQKIAKKLSLPLSRLQCSMLAED